MQVFSGAPHAEVSRIRDTPDFDSAETQIMLEERNDPGIRTEADEDRAMRASVPLINALVALTAGAAIAGSTVFASGRPTVHGPTFPQYGPADLLVVVAAIVWFFCTGTALGSAVRVYWTNRDAEQRHFAVIAFSLGLIAASLPWWPILWRWFGTHFKFA